MSLLGQLKKWLSRPDTTFPKLVTDYWYCGEWHLYQSDIAALIRKHKLPAIANAPWPGIDRFVFNPHKVGIINHDTSGLIDGLIPAIIKNGRVGLYRPVGPVRRDPFYDGATWDDGGKIDLEFVRSIPGLPEPETQGDLEEQ